MKKYTISLFILVAIFTAFFPLAYVGAQFDEPGYNPPVRSFTPANNTTSSQNISNNSSGNATIRSCDSLPAGIGKIICQANKILGAIVPLLLALGMVYFIWGVVQYMIGGDEEGKKKGRDRIIYGLIGLSVILTVWGLVNIVVTTFGLNGVPDVDIPLAPESLDNASCDSLPKNAKLQELLCYVTAIINDAIIPLIFALAMVTFIWGVVQFVINSDDEAKKTKGKNFMIWGIIALTVMVSVWGLVNILGGTFGIDSSFLPQVKP